MAKLTPLDIVKRTPKTNCGQCGYPTCLAFGAAVTTQGTAPDKCPFLDPMGLEQFVNVPSDTKERDLALVHHLKNKIRSLNFSTLAPILGLVAEDDTVLRFRFLGQNVALDRQGITINDTQPEDPRDQILLYNHLSMGAELSAPPPKAEEDAAINWVGMESLPNSISKIKTLETYCEQPLARLFAAISSREETTNNVWNLLQKIDAHTAPMVSADLSAIIPVLPAIPLQLLFWRAEPEDGFDARVKILFADTVLDALDIESLVFCCERLSERLAALVDTRP